MIKRTQVLMPATWTLLALFSVYEPVQAVESDVTPLPDQLLPHSSAVAELLRLSGLSVQLDNLPKAVISSFEQSIRNGGMLGPFEQQDIPPLHSALQEVFSSERLQASLSLQLESELSTGDISYLTTFYQSESGRELSQAERENSILSNADRFNVWHDLQGIRSLQPERAAVIAELEKSLHATDSAVDTLISMQVALQVGLMPALPAHQQESVSDLIDAARAHQSAMRRQYQASSLETLAFMFQNQSVDMLRDFNEVLQSGAGQRYVRATNIGLSRGMLNAAEELGQLLKPILTQRLGMGA
ncbi:hypothetical protein [Granulosicoccus antarcticus]|uniref:DUF2059 domain-containing protein n=1 Tax=Granulosicoccus antarcticus IMCC3135 TaxID=1192854 RepID=A0A2Z2NZN4_9GAMM|nr:hypothetical protein [Granulosicoccus antarcticus]ASJ74350.1 hypothetical protein IMCC3135_21365 [Granulosicoccus antarcticus IMCC3135]